MQCMLVYHTCMLVERYDVVFYLNAFCQREVDSLTKLFGLFYFSGILTAIVFVLFAVDNDRKSF